MTKLKKAGIWLLAAFLLASHVLMRTALHASEASTWRQVNTLTGDCSIAFPAMPKLMQQSIPVSEQGHKLNYDIYLAPLNDKSLCLLLVATYPYALRGGHELAGVEGLLNGILGQNPENKLIYANIIDKNGHPAVDFLVQSSSTFFRGQALMVGNKLYLMAIEGILGELNDDDFSHFAESFTLLATKPAK